MGKQPTRAPVWSAGVMGTARREGDPGNGGDPHRGEGSGLDVVAERRPRRVSDRVVVPLKPGNSGGGKDPDFWRAFDAGEEAVIGDEPGNARQDPEPAEEAVLQGEGGERHRCKEGEHDGSAVTMSSGISASSTFDACILGHRR